MEGVTTAIVAFIFACLIWPHLVKHKAQFHSALAMVLIVIFLDAIGHMTQGGALPHVMYVLAALVQILAIILLVLCVGGLTVRQLASEVSETIETIRRGTEDQKPVIVPRTGEVPIPKEDRPIPPPVHIPDPDEDRGIPLK